MRSTNNLNGKIRFSASTIFTILSGMALLFDLEIADTKLKVASTVIFAIITGIIYIKNQEKKQEIKEAENKKREDERQNDLIALIQERDAERAKDIQLLKAQIKCISSDLGLVKEQTEELTVLHKHSRYVYPFMTNISEHVTEIMQLSKIKNSELRDIFISSAEALKMYLKNIIQADFKNVNISEVQKILKVKAKAVRSAITKDKLNIKNADKFLEEIKNKVIDPEFTTFVSNLGKMIKEKNNGQRVEALTDITKDLLTNIIQEVNIKYKEYENGNH